MGATGEQSIAEELSAKQREISVAEFFRQNKQMLGFGSQARAMVTAVKEGVDNAIDAAEDAGILPYVRVTIEQADEGYYKVTIADNGPGITKENVPKVFGKLLYGSRFAKRVQRRGQQGIGISAAVLYGQNTTGRPANITSKVREKDQAEHFKVGIDTDNNEPKIQSSQETTWDEEFESGTSITVFLEANFRARKSLHKYIKRTAIVNPHATVEIHEPELDAKYERTVEELPDQPTEIDPHPHGIEFGTLRSMIDVTDSHSISGFLQSEFTRVGQTTAEKIVTVFIDNQFGRYSSFTPPQTDTKIPVEDVSQTAGQGRLSDFSSEDGVTFTEHIKNCINRKPEKVKQSFADNLVTDITASDSASYQKINGLVEQTANEIVNETDTTLGSTVKNKVIQGAWEYITTTRYETYRQIISDCVSERKSDQDVNKFTTELINTLDSSTTDRKYQFTRSALQKHISTAATEVDSEINATFGETTREKILDSIWETMDSDNRDPPLIREVNDNREFAETLHESMQQVDVMAPPSHCLSPIGANEMEKGLMKVYDCDFYSGASRSANSHNGEPFLVEAGIAYGGELESNSDISILRFANRVPLVYQQGACLTTQVISNIKWNNYKLSDKGGGLPQGPVAISVHVASTNVPFTSESKDAVATVDIISKEIERAVREVARDLKSYLDKEESRKERREKNNTVSELLPRFSEKIATITGKQTVETNESIAKIMNNVFVDTSSLMNSDKTGAVIRNHTSSNQSITISLTVTDSPTESNIGDWEINNEENTLSQTISVDKDSQTKIHPPESLDITNVTIQGIQNGKVTINS